MLLCLSASHKTAGFDLLEQLSTTPATIAGELVDDGAGVGGAVVLATCNRFEAYLDVEEAGSASVTAAVDRVVTLVSGSTGVDGERIRSGLDVLRGEAAARHLFAVSSGLESVVVGESEISGQVRRALESARTNGTTSAGLERVFQQASTTSREVRTTTSIGGAGRSIVRLALQLVESRVADWRDLDVVLIGTGRYAGATLAALRDRGVARVAVHSPSGRAARFASREGVSAVPAGGLRDAVAGASLVIACSTAATYLLDPSHFDGVDGSRMVVDLGLPRNVDPDVAGIEGVELLDLETISLHAPLRELRAADDADELVGTALGEYRAAEQEALVTPAIVAYRDHVFGVLEGELSRLRGRGAATEETERALRHLVSVLVHTPSTRARALARQGEADRFVDGIEALFGVAPQADTQAASAPLSCPVQHGTAS